MVKTVTKTYVPDIESYPPSKHQIESTINPGVSPHFMNSESIKRFQVEDVGKDIPDEFDWRDHGAVTDVKGSQGQCRSDPEFVVVGGIEALLKFRSKAKKAIDLSAQYLLECSTYPENQRTIQEKCDRRHNLIWLFNYIIDNGMVLEKDYKYTIANGTSGECDINKSRNKVYADIKEFWYIAQSEESMKVALYRYGPLMGIMCADWWFDHYKDGVFWMEKCKGEMRAVLIIGYGNHPYQYWIVKNSWGTKWGEFGYIRVARNIKTYGIHELAYFIV